MAEVFGKYTGTQTAATLPDLAAREGWIFGKGTTSLPNAKDWFAKEKKTNRMTLSQLRNWLAVRGVTEPANGRCR